MIMVNSGLEGLIGLRPNKIIIIYTFLLIVDYKLYADGIRKEYNHYSKHDYKQGRTAVSIYLGKCFSNVIKK